MTSKDINKGIEGPGDWIREASIENGLCLLGEAFKDLPDDAFEKVCQILEDLGDEFHEFVEETNRYAVEYEKRISDLEDRLNSI